MEKINQEESGDQTPLKNILSSMATLDTKELKKVFAEVDSHNKSQIKEV
jgi:hypothetical protein